MATLVTGAAGFIGFHVARRLLERGDAVMGFDNLNDYYDVSLKEARLANLNGEQGFHFVKGDLQDAPLLQSFCKEHQVDRIIHLAAQAGVRYSIENPQAYVDSNISGFLNILDVARDRRVKHLVYASSSSVYGDHNSIPYSTQDRTDRPSSLYAATKVANELMAHVYYEQNGLSVTGLRFFTVYGPWGRPDMSPFLFLKALLNGETISLFNHGNHRRDFTYIDDIVEGVVRISDDSPITPLYRLYNIGRGDSVCLGEYVSTLEQLTDLDARIEYAEKQPGDVEETHADIADLKRDFDYAPSVDLEEGLQSFVTWYRDYYET